jgi:hypothetical protein
MSDQATTNHAKRDSFVEDVDLTDEQSSNEGKFKAICFSILNDIIIVLSVDEYMRKRFALIQNAKKDHFSSEVELHKMEVAAEKKLF